MITREDLEKIITYDDDITNRFQCASTQEMMKFSEELLSRLGLYRKRENKSKKTVKGIFSCLRRGK